MPTYQQIKSYIDNRRRRIGENNDLEQLKAYINKHLTFQPGLSKDNELFTFGVDYGTGTDDDHFNCGLTSIKLLQQMEEINRNNGLFHLDATYKIVKYDYPLNVFGFSDLVHKFQK